MKLIILLLVAFVANAADPTEVEKLSQMLVPMQNGHLMAVNTSPDPLHELKSKVDVDYFPLI